MGEAYVNFTFITVVTSLWWSNIPVSKTFVCWKLPVSQLLQGSHVCQKCVELESSLEKSGKSVSSLELALLSGKCLEKSLLKKLQKISWQAFTCIHIFFISWLCLTYVRQFLIVFFEHTPKHLPTQFYSTPKHHKFTKI